MSLPLFGYVPVLLLRNVLVFESQNQRKLKGAEVARQAAAAREARERAQKKRDELLQELENDEQRLKKGKFLGYCLKFENRSGTYIRALHLCVLGIIDGGIEYYVSS